MLDNLVYRQKVGAGLLAGAFLLYVGTAMVGGHSHQTYSPVAGPVIVPQGNTTTTVQTTAGWRPFVCHNRGEVKPFRIIPQGIAAPDQYTTRSGNIVTFIIMTPSKPTPETGERVSFDITTQICGFPRY
jgi:hypothetical protein